MSRSLDVPKRHMCVHTCVHIDANLNMRFQNKLHTPTKIHVHTSCINLKPLIRHR